MKLPVYILAGGCSSRFGSDKAWAELDGIPLLRRIADAAASIASSTTIVAAHTGKYDALGLETIADDVPGRGPLSGIATALSHQDAWGWVLVLACDLAHVQPHWLQTLSQAALKEEASADVVLFDSNPAQPLLACYHCRMLPQVIARLDGTTRGTCALLEELRVIRIPPPEDWCRLVNVNAPADLWALSHL
jgi:molybdopterin-guanine dinucleotide biosynthesis protein A